MLKSKFKYPFIIAVIITQISSAQNDSILNFSEFLNQVMTHHPIVYQSNFVAEQGNQIVRKARGGFDPKLSGSLNQKQFNGSEYYNQLNGKLEVPTWYGIKGIVGYEQNNGVFLNPELNTPNAGLVNLGASINIGKGLFMNKRMADLKQAKLLQNTSLIEQKILLNTLELNASKTYWSWVKSYTKAEVYKQAYETGLDIFNGVVNSYEQGDKPAIDTVEARINLQNIKIKFNQAQVEYINETQSLQTYLWLNGNIPVEVRANTKPPLFFKASDLVIEPDLNVTDSLIAKHPLLKAYNNKQAVYNIDLKLKKESLKPDLELKYNLLNEPVNASSASNFNTNDYKFGATLSYPILNRKARAGVQLTKLKLNNLELDYLNKKREIEFKLTSLKNELTNIKKQTQLGSSNVNNYKRMYDSEQTLLAIGESSVFLVNYRMNSFIKSQVEQIDFLYSQEIIKQKLIYESFIKYQL